MNKLTKLVQMAIGCLSVEYTHQGSYQRA